MPLTHRRPSPSSRRRRPSCSSTGSTTTTPGRWLPVVVDITRSGQQLFHAALPGTAPDNDAWVVRKSAVVSRFGHSSLYMGQLCRDAGTTLAERYGLSEEEYAAHGGAFPLVVR